jgi:hypothetical protein
MAPPPKRRSIQVGRETLVLSAEIDRFLTALRGVVAGAVVEQLPRQRDDAKLIALMQTITATQERETESAFAASPTGRAERASIACAAGCAFCCRNSVEITIPEAIVLALAATQGADAAAMAERFAATATAIQGLKPLARQARAIPCPVLVDEACSRYTARPLACRSTYATSAQACERDLVSVSTGGRSQQIKMPATPQVIRTGVVEGIQDGLTRRKLQADTVELIGAVNAILQTPALIDRWLAGEKVFAAFWR